jgi:Protein of unknown function (DUF4238)
MPQNKRHHYVPRFYLKRFTTDERFINLYNIKSAKKIINGKLKHQCYRDYLYGKDRPIEKALSDIECEVSDLLKKIDEYVSLPRPGTMGQFTLLVHLLVQYGRTIYAAEAINEMFDKATKETLSEYMMQKEGIDLSNFTIGMEDTATYSLGLSMRMYPLLLDLHYKLLINKTSVEFITSDHPIVMYNQLLTFRTFGSNCGVACKGLQIFYPLDPKKVLMLYDGQVYRVGSKRIAIDITNPQDVYELNTLQMCSAKDNVYFKDQNIDIHALHRKAKPHLRTVKANVRSMKMPGSDPKKREKFVAMSTEDVRTNLSLSPLTLRTSAKTWRNEARRQKMQPGAVIRDQQNVDDFKEFEADCKKGKYKPSEFIDFLAEKYGWDADEKLMDQEQPEQPS